MKQHSFMLELETVKFPRLSEKLQENLIKMFSNKHKKRYLGVKKKNQDMSIM